MLLPLISVNTVLLAILIVVVLLSRDNKVSGELNLKFHELQQQFLKIELALKDDF